jgi:hypothetical protein
VGSFSVSSASISSVTPTSLIGGVITITGAGFGTLSDETAVVIGGYCCEIISWEDTEIVAIVSNSITAGVYDVAVVTSNASCAIEEDAIDIQVPSDTGDTTYVSTTGPDGKDNSAFVVSDGTYKSLGDVVLTNGVLILWCTDTPEVTIGGNSVTMTRYNGTDTWDMYYASNVVYNGVLRLSATGSDKSYADIRGYNRTVSNGALKYLYNDMVQNSGDSTLPWF